MLLLLWGHLVVVLLLAAAAAAAWCGAGLVELRTLVVMVRLERMRLPGMESEVMSASVAKHRHLDYSGPVKARLTSRALALEGL